jgi:hypothetical protein
MTLWAKLIAAIVGLIRSFVDYAEARRNEELGRLKEREANDRENDSLRDVIRRANADSVSDDDAFGPSRSGNNLPSTGTGRPANRPD